MLAHAGSTLRAAGAARVGPWAPGAAPPTARCLGRRVIVASLRTASEHVPTTAAMHGPSPIQATCAKGHGPNPTQATSAEAHGPNPIQAKSAEAPQNTSPVSRRPPCLSVCTTAPFPGGERRGQRIGSQATPAPSHLPDGPHCIFAAETCRKPLSQVSSSWEPKRYDVPSSLPSCIDGGVPQSRGWQDGLKPRTIFRIRKSIQVQ